MSKEKNIVTPIVSPIFHTSKWTLLAVALGFVMATLDVTIVNVALVDMQKGLNISMPNLTWVIDGYILTFASFLLAGGAVANRIGAKQAYLIGLSLFVFASFLCGVAMSGQTLIIARMLQGIGAALFMPSSLTLLVISYPEPIQRAKIIGLWAAIISISAALGPSIGGILVFFFGWQSIFFLNLPIGLLGLYLNYRVIQSTQGNNQPTNYVSHILGFAALASASFTLIEGPSLGWLSEIIILATVMSIFFALLFIINEQRTKHPVIARELFHQSAFSTANFIGFLMNFATFGLIFILSLFFQKVRGASALEAGNQLLPMMAMFALANVIASKLATRLASQWLLLFGVSIAGLAISPLLGLSPQTPYWVIAFWVCLANFGVGIAVPAMTTTVMQIAGSTHANIASATLNANRQLGALFGIAILSSILQHSSDWYLNLRLSLTTVVAVQLFAAFLTWFYLIRSNKSVRVTSTKNLT